MLCIAASLIGFIHSFIRETVPYLENMGLGHNFSRPTELNRAASMPQKDRLDA